MSPNDAVPDPLVSVVIPTYNRKAFLCDAVQSCLDQSYGILEVVIVDDGSTDGTDLLVKKKLQTAWKGKVRFLAQVNFGASSARNFGVANSLGKYVQFLDSDDILLPDKISEQVAILEKSAGRAVVVCSCYGLAGMIDMQRSRMRRIGLMCNSPQEYVRKMTSGEIHVMQTSAALWLRSYLTEHEGWRADISLGDDREYYVRLLGETGEVAFCENELFILREHEGDRLSDAYANPERIRSAIRTLQSVTKQAIEMEVFDKEVAKGVFKQVRTLYVNLLSVQAFGDLGGLENWSRDIAEQCSLQLPINLRGIFLLRRVCGPVWVTHFYSLYMRLTNLRV